MDFAVARTNMIKQQLLTGNITQSQVLDLFQTMPREYFVPTAFQNFAYSDMQIPLSENECMMTPLEEATLLQALNIQGHEKILEIGTGSGFLTALLAKLAAQVVSLDIHAPFTELARRKLSEHELNNIQLHTEDGYAGFVSEAPYDIIVFTGALTDVLPLHQLQVLPGGKIFALVGSSALQQGQVLTLDHHENWSKEIIFETNLPHLIHGRKDGTFQF